MLSSRARWLSIGAGIVVVALVAGGITWRVLASDGDSAAGAPAVGPAAASDSALTPIADRIVFRETAIGADYGHVAWVPLDDQSAARTIEAPACDRIDATELRAICLRVDRSGVDPFEAVMMDSSFSEGVEWQLAGIPSRTRLSDDSRFVATTSFVSGHSYGTVGFSTETVISSVDGTSYGNLESYDLYVNSQLVSPVDRNIWGITFVDDSTFYATVAFGDQHWLARGNLDERSLTTLREGMECPSISPDGTRIGFKKNLGTTETPHWVVAVYTLNSGMETVLGETRNVDDQVEWLDDDTILYGLANETVGDSDIWAVSATDPAAAPELFIEHAWSPAVVR